MIKALGIDIGGTNIKSCLTNVENPLDTSSYTILDRKTVPTEARLGKDRIIENIVKSIKLYEDYKDFDYIGIASAGTIDFNLGKVIYATNALPNFSGLNLKEQVERQIGKEIVLINDAQAAALAEANYKDNLQGAAACLCLTLGTGLGSTLVKNKTHIADIHLGHETLHENGRVCFCGKRGCAEAYVSATGIANNAGCSDLKRVFLSSEQSFLEAKNAFFEDFAKTLKFAASKYSFECIIVGGGVIELSDLWWDDFMKVYSGALNIKIAKANLRNSAGAIGAIYAAINKEFIISEV